MKLFGEKMRNKYISIIFAMILSVLITPFCTYTNSPDVFAAETLANKRLNATAKAIADFEWTETDLVKWNGTYSNCYSGGVFSVYTPEQFAFAIAYAPSYGGTINVYADLDMNGASYSISHGNWSGVVLNGNNHTIYNVNVASSGYAGLCKVGAKCTIKDITFKSFWAYNYGHNNAGLISHNSGYNYANRNNFINVDITDGIFGGHQSSALVGPLGGYGSVYAENCIATRCTSVGNYHIGGIFGLHEPGYFINCAARDGFSIDFGGHGGGFVSCSDSGGIFYNSWSNQTCYGTADMGGMCSGCDTTGGNTGGLSTHCFYYKCFTSGVVESDYYAGGFFGRENHGSGRRTYCYDCYSTAMVGMNYGASYQGGFMGVNGGNQYYNCYAAGEIGSIDTNFATSGSVGGFFGSGHPVRCSNCYWDMQTTAMNYNGAGPYRNYWTLQRTENGVETNWYGGLKGVTTRILTNDTGMLGSNYVYKTGLYPMTTETYTNKYSENRDMFRAYAVASASTVFCDDWTDISSTGFDNIRDIIRPLAFTSIYEFNGNIKFNDAYTPDSGATSIDWIPDGTVSLVDGVTKVVSLTDSSPYYSLSLYPGIEWVQVNVRVGDEIGSRRLRIIPTSVIEVGDDVLLDIYRYNDDKSDIYDYKTDYKTTYIEKNVLLSLMNSGVVNTSYLKMHGDITDETYFDNIIQGTVNFPFNSTQKTALSKVEFNRNTTNDGMASVENWYEKMNGIKKFESGDADVYTINFKVFLNDGRFLENTKDVNIIVPYAVGYYYNYDGRLNGKLIKPTSLFYSQYDLDDFDHGFVFLSYGTNPVRDGYQFIGWTLDPENTIPVDQSYFDNYSSVVGELKTNIKVYANWLNNDFCPHLIIDPNGGTYNGSADKRTIVQLDNTTFNVDGTLEGWDDYHFVGWEFTGAGAYNATDEANGHGVYTFGRGAVTGTLTAQWAKQLPVVYEDRVENSSGKLLGSKTLYYLPNTVVSGADLGTDTTKGKYYPGYTYIGNSGSVTLNAPKTVYRYFELNRHNVTYDKNIAKSTALYGEPKVEVQYTLPVDTRYTSRESNAHYATRIGWNFIGWSQNRNSEVVYGDNTTSLTMPDNDITLYAIYSRYLRLILDADVVTGQSSYTFSKTIYNSTPNFNFDDSDVTNSSSRGTGSYTVEFETNGGTLIDLGGLTYSDGSEWSTPLQDGKIIAYPKFSGWYTLPYSIGEYLGSHAGYKVGNAGDSFVITPDVDNAYKYDVKGSSMTSGATVVSRNNVITLYPQWDKAKIKLPDAVRDSRDSGTDMNNGSDKDLFLGWFTKPQLSSETTDGGSFVGAAGDEVWIDRDITLYPWFNIAPLLVRSEVTNNITNPAASHSNMFWEGQSVSYEQLLSLINGSDVDNFNAGKNANERIEWNGLGVWKDMYLLNIQSYLNSTLLENNPSMSYEQRMNYINGVISKFSTYANIYDTDGQNDNNDFEPYIIGIDYYCDGLDTDGNLLSTLSSDNQSDVSGGLLTDANHIGKIVIHYAISDNGTFDFYNREYVTDENGYRNDSNITVYFDLVTSIAFDNPPELDLDSVYMFAKDPSITSSNVERYLLSKHIVSDVEDDFDNMPWWYKGNINGTSNITSSRFDIVYNTRDNLVKSMKTTGVSDIRFQPGYEAQHEEACQSVKSITDLKELFKLKDNGNDIFNYITSFDVTVDCHDQWGKYASSLPCGATSAERTFTVIIFNNYDDYDLATSAIEERIRYIDDYESSFLSNRSFWGEAGFGKELLDNTFERYIQKNDVPFESYSGQVGNPQSDNKNRTVTIHVNDYAQ